MRTKGEKIKTLNDSNKAPAFLKEKRQSKISFFQPGTSTQLSPINIQQKMSSDESQRSLQRTQQTTTTSATPSVISGVSESGGNSLDGTTKDFMENKFGYDFSNVKIHTDSVSAKSAQSINAAAYTVGNNIVFNEGQYSPGSKDGKRLLAHELTHVIQQNSGIVTNDRIQREPIYEEVAHFDNQVDGIYSGSVDRYQYENKKDYNERVAKNRKNAFYHAKVNLRFDSNQCVLEIPVSVNIVNNDKSGKENWHTHCSYPGEPFRPVSQDVFNSAVPRLMSLIPESLEGWFNVHLGNPGVAGCKSSTIPIRVILTQQKTDPDYLIILTENEGSSYVDRDASTGHGGMMVLCDAVSKSGTIIHEAGHMVIGAGDEYRGDEPDEPEAQERLGEYSWMAKDAPERLLRFYEHHFQFAPEFMNTILPGCNASLVSGSKKLKTEITPQAGFGYLNTGDNEALFISLGTQFGIPLTSMRQLSLVLRPEAKLLFGIGNSPAKEHNIFSLMMGVQAGLEYRKHFGHLARDNRVGFHAGIGGEAGGLLNFAKDPGGLPSKTLIPYMEANASLGIELESRASLSVEAGKGTMFPGDSHDDIDYYKFGFKFSLNY